MQARDGGLCGRYCHGVSYFQTDAGSLNTWTNLDTGSSSSFQQHFKSF